MANRRKRNEGIDPFENPITETDYIYGDNDELMPISAPPQIVHSIDIFKLTADRTQPRRTVPSSIRSDWDGRADAVPTLLRRWHEAADKELSQHIDIARIFKGYALDFEINKSDHPIAGKLMSLIELADTIRRDGLENPININRVGDGGNIDRGERRWLAHHLLSMFDSDSDKWKSIPAVDVKPSVWAQAAENGARDELNAIEKARQLALLIMDLHDRDGKEFDSFDTLVSPGKSDRAFYAQVRNGYVYSLSKEDSQRIVSVMGLRSSAQISQYRRLLELPDDIWIHADENNLAEGKIRNDYLTPTKENQDKDDESLTIVKPSNDDLPDESPSPTAENDPIPLKLGQIRIQQEGKEFPYILLENNLGRGDWRIIVTQKTGYYDQVISESAINQYYPVVLNYVPELPTSDDNEIVINQVRARYTEKDFPYIRILSQFSDGTHGTEKFTVKMVRMHHAPVEQKMSKQQILNNWSRVLPAEPTYNAGIEVPMGMKTPEYGGQATGQLQFEEGRRPSIYGGQARLTVEEQAEMAEPNLDPPSRPKQTRIPGTDEANQISFIALRPELDRLLHRWKELGINMNMPDQVNTLRKINLFTPETVRTKVAKGGRAQVQSEVNEIDQALDTILEGFKDQWGEWIRDIYDSAKKAAQDQDSG